MKIWNAYGSEHSANLVMIGHFKDAGKADEVKAAIDEITEYVNNAQADELLPNRYSEGVMALFTKLKCHSVAPNELEQFRYDIHCKVDGDDIVITTDEMEISAFLKLLFDKGARIEVYSAHDYPDTGKGR